MPFKILVVDDKIDDKSDEISELPRLLREHGYEVESTSDGSAAYDLFWECNPDLVLLDIVFQNQPLDGIELCRAIRQNGSDVPIILITAVMKETEQVLRGFEAGADDYVIRPRDNREILARIRANLPPEVLIFDDYLMIDFVSRRVWVKRGEDWTEVHLQRLQFELLDVLVMNAGRIVASTSLKDRVWGKPVSDDILAAYINRLRKKLEPDPDHPKYIETIRGLGYRFNGRPTRAASPLARPRTRCCRGD
jgi:DNA-binding response OmpR family regulator